MKHVKQRKPNFYPYKSLRNPQEAKEIELIGVHQHPKSVIHGKKKREEKERFRTFGVTPHFSSLNLYRSTHPSLLYLYRLPILFRVSRHWCLYSATIISITSPTSSRPPLLCSVLLFSYTSTSFINGLLGDLQPGLRPNEIIFFFSLIF